MSYLLITLGLLVLVIVLEILLLPFLKFFSDEFFDFFASFSTWVPPILLGLFAASSAFYRDGFIEHKCIKEDPNKENQDWTRKRKEPQNRRRALVPHPGADGVPGRKDKAKKAPFRGT